MSKFRGMVQWRPATVISHIGIQRVFSATSPVQENRFLVEAEIICWFCSASGGWNCKITKFTFMGAEAKTSSSTISEPSSEKKPLSESGYTDLLCQGFLHSPCSFSFELISSKAGQFFARRKEAHLHCIQATVWQPGHSYRRVFCLLTANRIEGNVEVKFPTIWTDGKAEVGGVREEKRREEKRREEKRREEKRREEKRRGEERRRENKNQRSEKVRRKKMQVREKVEKSLASTCTKHTMLGALLEIVMSKKCTPLWREAHFQAKMYKTHQLRSTFGS